MRKPTENDDDWLDLGGTGSSYSKRKGVTNNPQKNTTTTNNTNTNTIPHSATNFSATAQRQLGEAEEHHRRENADARAPPPSLSAPSFVPTQQRVDGDTHNDKPLTPANVVQVSEEREAAGLNTHRETRSPPSPTHEEDTAAIERPSRESSSCSEVSGIEPAKTVETVSSEKPTTSATNTTTDVEAKTSLSSTAVGGGDTNTASAVEFVVVSDASGSSTASSDPPQIASDPVPIKKEVSASRAAGGDTDTTDGGAAEVVVPELALEEEEVGELNAAATPTSHAAALATAASATTATSLEARISQYSAAFSDLICQSGNTVLSYLSVVLSPRTIAALRGIGLGFYDSSNMVAFTTYCAKDPTIAKGFASYTALNALLFSSLFTIIDLIAPLQPMGAFAVVWETLFGLLWVVPMYAITQVLGITWYEEIYRKCVRIRARERNRPEPPTRSASFIGVSELLMKFLVTLVYGVLAAVIAIVVPSNLIVLLGCVNVPVGFGISFAMSCWLHAFYCFDYRFLDQGKIEYSAVGSSPATGGKANGDASSTKSRASAAAGQQRADLASPMGTADPSAVHSSGGGVPRLIPAKLSFLLLLFEKRWPYYLGYGASHILIRTMMEMWRWPLFARMAVCSTLFAVNIITTVDATVKWEGDDLIGRLPIFTPFYTKLSEWVANRSDVTKRRKVASAVKGASTATTTSASTSSITSAATATETKQK